MPIWKPGMPQKYYRCSTCHELFTKWELTKVTDWWSDWADSGKRERWFCSKHLLNGVSK